MVPVGYLIETDLQNVGQLNQAAGRIKPSQLNPSICRRFEYNEVAGYQGSSNLGRQNLQN